MVIIFDVYDVYPFNVYGDIFLIRRVRIARTLLFLVTFRNVARITPVFVDLCAAVYLFAALMLAIAKILLLHASQASELCKFFMYKCTRRV